MNKKIIILSIITIFILQLNSFGKYGYSKKINVYQLFFKPIDYNYNINKATTQNINKNINESNAQDTNRDINENTSNNNLNYILKKDKKDPEIVQIIK